VSTEVFVDESRRGLDYMLAAVSVEARDLKSARSTMRKMLLPGERRLHFSKETIRRRRDLLDRIAREEFSVEVLSCRASQNVARSLLLGAVVSRSGASLSRLVIESRDIDDVQDIRCLVRLRSTGLMGTDVIYDHVLPYEEPLLWVADAVAWAWGAGGDWRRRVEPIVTQTVRIEP